MYLIDSMIIKLTHLAVEGKEEFAIFFRPADGSDKSVWEIQYGNPCPHVLLGEVEGRLSVEANSLAGALYKILDKIEQDTP